MGSILSLILDYMQNVHVNNEQNIEEKTLGNMRNTALLYKAVFKHQTVKVHICKSQMRMILTGSLDRSQFQLFSAAVKRDQCKAYNTRFFV